MSPILERNALEIFSRSAEQTRRIGMRLGAMLRPGMLVALQGDLGAGKTTFVQGLVSGWGSLDQVTSPTFVLVNVYRHPTGAHLYHLDAYRLNSALEATDLDLEAMLSTGPLVVEWANRVQAALPPEGLWLKMRWLAEEHRSLQFAALGKSYLKLLEKLKQQVYGI